MSELPEYVLDRIFDAPRPLVWRAWTDPQLLARWYGPGVETIIHTDISRDGVLTGVNAEKSAEIAAATGLNVIGSGGVASLDDIQRCIDHKLAGVITGRAIYEGELDLKEAIALC